jgi:hypothetical protein
VDGVESALIITTGKRWGSFGRPTDAVDVRVEERDLEWSKAEFSQRTLDNPPFPIMMAVVEAAVTANMCRARARIAGRHTRYCQQVAISPC